MGLCSEKSVLNWSSLYLFGNIDVNASIILQHIYFHLLPFVLPLQEVQLQQAMKEPYGRILAECPAEEDLLTYER